MDQQLKQRLLGAVILVALAVIFFPMLFDGSPYQAPKIEHQAIPVPSAKPNVKDIVPDRLESENALDIKPATAEDSIEAEAEINATPAVTAIPAAVEAAANERVKDNKAVLEMPKSWLIQLASFKDKSNAEALQEQLRAQNFNAFVKTVDGSKISYRVYIGPELKREKAEAVLKQVYQEYKLEGILIEYNISEL